MAQAYPPKDLKELIPYVKERGVLFAHSGVGSPLLRSGVMSATGAKLTLSDLQGQRPH